MAPRRRARHLVRVPTPTPAEVLERLHADMVAFARATQDALCRELERVDGAARFSEDAWERPGGGGGISRVLQEGAVFEKAGVSFSDVHGALSPDFARKVGGEGAVFAATGLSVVIHPLSPMVPTAHMNVRLIRRGGAAWFGGGADLTPHYLFEEDCVHFHSVLREVCERHEPGSYARHKRAADAYFHLRHRGEHRGVGGMFFEDSGRELAREVAFAQDVARCVRRGVPAHRREAPGPRVWRGRAALAGDPPRPLRGVQPRPQSRDGVRARDGRANRVDPHVPPAARALGLRPRAGAGEPGGGATRGAARAARLGVSAAARRWSRSSSDIPTRRGDARAPPVAGLPTDMRST